MSIISGFFWRFIERIGRQGIALLVYLILARLLLPEDYGTLAILQAFITISEIIVTGGLNNALMQKKDVKDEDFSSILYVSLGVAFLAYIFIFLVAPYIAIFYGNTALILPLRIIALILFPYALNSVQLAWSFRNGFYKKTCFAQIFAVTFAGIIAIVLAYYDFGIWALVANSLLCSACICIVLQFTISWHPKLTFSWKRSKKLISYGWKIMVVNLIDRSYVEISTFLLGKKYSTETLGYYNQGKQYPAVLYDIFASTILGVLFPALSKKQDDNKDYINLLRKTVSIGTYIIMPCMIGFSAVGYSLVKVLLTDKWLPTVPFLQIFCLSYLISVLSTMILQAVNAIGRSDLSLRLNIVQKAIGVLLILVALFGFEEPTAVVYAVLITSGITLFTNLIIEQKYVGYSCKQFILDILPTVILSAIMGICVEIIGRFITNSLLCLIIQIAVGIIIYVLLSIITRNKNWDYCAKLIFRKLK